MYTKVIKRLFDIILSFCAIIIFSPLLLILTMVGMVVMKGNPFFTQKRPGYKERIFRLIKFRSMTNEKDETGNLLPDEKRLIPYGRFLRSSSLDELPELFNILKGDMSFVGPRPLLPEYLPRYSEEQHRRHNVMPGLTGYAQVCGRNAISWEEKFKLDVWYADHQSFFLDISILFKTVSVVFKHKGITSENGVSMEEFMGDEKEVLGEHK